MPNSAAIRLTYQRRIFNRTCKLKGIEQVSPTLVDEVYESRMLSIQGHAELSHLEKRLKMVLGPKLYPFALELLTEVATTGVLTAQTAEIISSGYSFEGRANRDVLQEILGILELVAWISLSRFLIQSGELAQAEGICNNLVRHVPGSDSWAYFGEFLHSIGRYEEAEQAYVKAIELDPESPWIWTELGTLRFKHLKKTEEAKAAFQKAIDVEGWRSRAWPSFLELRTVH